MERSIKIDAFAVPRALPSGDPAVHVSVYYGKMALHQRLTMDEAEDAHARLSSAIGAIRLGKSLAAGADPRDQERRYRAKLAVRLGLAVGDVCAVFDISLEQYARLAAEVRS